jgi:transposase InsO family protein
MVLRIESGRPVAHVAAEMGISRPTAYKWWNRWAEGGSLEALTDRSSRPRSCPHQTPPEVEAQIAELRQLLKLGPARIGGRLGVPASTVHRVLVRLGLNRLSWMDRPTGRVIRRIHTEHPGQLVHIDVKKLGRIPEGGGWWAHGRENRPHRKAQSPGYAFVHSAIDAHSRLAFSEVLDDEKGPTCAGFFDRARQFFAQHRIDIDAVLTDNAKNYLGKDFTAALGGIEHRRIRRYRPQTNGKVERFNRTLLEEWAYVRVYRSEAERTAALDDWLHLYNHHRHHTAIDGAPITRVNNLPGHYS